MGNTFVDDPTLPDPQLLTTLRPIASSQIARVGELNNWLISEAGASSFWSQAWPDGMPQSLLAPATVAQVVIPLVGARHTGLTALVDCKPSAGTDLDVGIVRSLAGGLTAIPAGSPRGWYRIAAETMSGAAEDIYVLRADGIGTIYGVAVEVAPLTSPLAAGLEDASEPLGLTSLGAGYPLTAHAGRALVDTLEELAERPRSLLAWSACDETSASAATQHPPRLLAASIGGWSHRRPGVEAVYQVRVRVDGAAGRVYVGRVALEAAAGPAWLSTTITIPPEAADWEHDLAPLADGLRDYLRPAVASVDNNDVWPDVGWRPDGLASDPGVEIKSVCVWGV